MDPLFIVFILVLIVSVILHELAHGYSAKWLGDPTAEYAGRLTLNPIKHLEWFGSFILPTLSYLLGGFLIGWAKPVPYNPYNFKKFARFGDAIVAFAGPATNIILAIIFSIFYRFIAESGAMSDFSTVSYVIVLVNVILAVFNLLPIPPLDGSKILFSLLPRRFDHIKEFLDRYSLFVAIAILILIFPLFSGVLHGIVRFLLGI